MEHHVLVHTDTLFQQNYHKDTKEKELVIKKHLKQNVFQKTVCFEVNGLLLPRYGEPSRFVASRSVKLIIKILTMFCASKF